MAFFEQLGKRLTDMGQGVAKQTKNFTDITRLNAAISDKEKQVSQFYLALGQAYYEMHQNNPNAELGEQIEEIRALRAQILQYQEEIKRIKCVVKCISCGADLPPNSTFCSACGARVVQEKLQEPVPAADVCICPSCNTAIKPENLFCTQCGTRLQKSEESEE